MPLAWPVLTFLPDLSRRGSLTRGKRGDRGRISTASERPNAAVVFYGPICAVGSAPWFLSGIPPGSRGTKRALMDVYCMFFQKVCNAFYFVFAKQCP